MKRIFLLPLVVLCLAAVPFSASADYGPTPDRSDMKHIRSLARELDRQADNLLDAVERNRPRGDRHQDRALGLVERFRHEAATFEDVVESNMNRPERTVAAYRSLTNTYERLIDRAEDRYVRPRVGRLLDDTKVTVASISQFYERPRIDWQRVQFLAHEIDTLSDRVYDGAKRELTRRSGYQYDWRVKDTLDRLDTLRRAADHFHRQVEKGRVDPAHIRSDFTRLQQARNDVASRIWNLEYETRRDFYRLSDYLGKLDANCYGDARNDRRDDNREYRDDKRDNHDNRDGRDGHRDDGRHASVAPHQTLPQVRPANLESSITGLLVSIFGNEIRF